MRPSIAITAAVLAFLRAEARAQSHGIPERVPNMDLQITGLPGEGAHPVPAKLSDLPALLLASSGRGHEVPGVLPYEPSAKLWSDGAHKERYFALPDYAFPAPGYARLTYRAAGGWDFPENSVVIKNFLLPLDLRDPDGSLKRVETRILYQQQGSWVGFTYEWNEEGTDALLLPPERKTKDVAVVGEDGQLTQRTWTYPSREECLQCHTAAANRVLGLNTPQMNHVFTYPSSGVADNQLGALEHIGLFDAPLPGPPDTLPRMPDAFDMSQGLESRARAYLAANCGICHRPGAPVDASVNFTWEVAREDMNAVGVRATRGSVGLPEGATIIEPGEPDLSVLVARVQTLDPVFRMPRIGSRVVDEQGVALLRGWITSLGIPAPRGLAAAAAARDVELHWSPVAPDPVDVSGYNVYRSETPGAIGAQRNEALVPATAFTDPDVPPGRYFYSVTAVGEGVEGPRSIQVEVLVEPPGVRFLRGNCNGDAALDVSDAIFHLSYLFSGGPASPCEPACDSDASGTFEITDPVRTLGYLFLSGPAPAGLFPECETADPGSCADACPGV